MALARARAASISRLWGTALVAREINSIRSRGNPVNGAIKGWFVDFRRLDESRDFSHELQGSPLNLGFRGRRIEIVKGFDVSAHAQSPPRILIYR
jgi:hypothetical protein